MPLRAFCWSSGCTANAALRKSIEDMLALQFVLTDKWDSAPETSRRSRSLVLDLEYPTGSSAAAPGHGPSFERMLEHSLHTERRIRAWSEHLRGQADATQVKSAVALPSLMMINLAGPGSSHLPYYRRTEGNFLPPIVYARGTHIVVGAPSAAKAEDAQLSESSSKAAEEEGPRPELQEGDVCFDLVAIVSHIASHKAGKNNFAASSGSGGADDVGSRGHLVTHVRLLGDYEQIGSEQGGEGGDASAGVGTPVPPGTWILLNDFAVSTASQEQVLDFSQDYRNPCIAVYRRRQEGVDVDDDAFVRDVLQEYSTQHLRPPPCPIPREVFLAPSISRAPKASQRMPTFTQLDLSELPGKGSIVAIDCEFVALSTEEFEVRADGSRQVTSQSRLSLGRVSCLTGDEVVFVDDYIVAPEPVMDYLTRFSGLVQGDLDPSTSVHHLLPLKVAYMKLRYLVDQGCIFVGHGLATDFRVVNVLVPPEQIRDTVDLFHLAGQRKLSLRFLARHLLKQEIQEKVHDSIEDARTALLLFRKYEELVAQGTLTTVLHELYADGHRANWA